MNGSVILICGKICAGKTTYAHSFTYMSNSSVPTICTSYRQHTAVAPARKKTNLDNGTAVAHISANDSALPLPLLEKGLKMHKGVLLSCDEIMLELRGLFADDKYDAVLAKVQNYLFNKSLDIVHQGLDAVLDWGFWRREDRRKALDFYLTKGIKAAVHYLEIDDATLAANVARRNASKNADAAYYVDDGLMSKCNSIFEPPNNDESGIIKIDIGKSGIG